MNEIISEDSIEQLAIEHLQSIGWDYMYGPMLASDGEFPERDSYNDVILKERLRQHIAVINEQIPISAQEEAINKVLRIGSPDMMQANEDFHIMLTEGVDVTYTLNGETRGDKVLLIDYQNPENNNYVCVNQFTITEGTQHKRPDIILFINGIPLVIIELKNPADAKATVEKAYTQLNNYKTAVPSLFPYNAFMVASDGFEAKAGSISASFSRYSKWKTKDGKTNASHLESELLVLIEGLLNKNTLLDYLRYFIVFEKDKKEDPVTQIITIETIKKIAAYHQYYAVNKAVDSTVQATGFGDKDATQKGGIVWHTQGSGKSLSMVFYTGKIIQALNNPTIVVITDRNDLDQQLFDTFAACRQLLRQAPTQAQNRDDLKDKLQVAAGGVVFTTVQKFFPEEGQDIFPLLSDRKNIVVIADEAHRTQYGFEAKNRIIKDEEGKEIGARTTYGFAKYMRDALPAATFIGFTGTPVELTDRNTKTVFGDYIDVYDIQQAVEDGATVRIYYESRLAKVNIDPEAKELLDEEFEEITEDKELTDKQKAKAKWARLEAIVGNANRIKNVAADIVNHFEERQEVFEGKGMIVCMSRRICVLLYEEIIKLKPHWHSKDDNEGAIKVVMTGSSSDPATFQPHLRSKERNKAIGERLKEPKDELKLVLVRDMWLTGFDAPSLHTLYVDKPMKGHSLMQAIARVNRVYLDKPGGLIVDYIGIAQDLKKALSTYTESGGKGKPTFDIDDAIAIMMEKLEVVRQIMNGYDYTPYFTAPVAEKLSIILTSEEHILSVENGKERFNKEVSLLSKAFALCKSTQEAADIALEVAFFQIVKARLSKFNGNQNGKTDEEIETAIRQMVDKAIVSNEVVDIFNAAGIKKPDISILSDEFLQEVRGMQHKNLALELLKKLLNDELKSRSTHNLILSKKFSEMLENAIKKYQNQLLTSAEILNELIGLAKDLRQTDEREAALNLTKDEIAFYDAICDNDAAKQIMEDEQLREIARELVDKVKANTTIDWQIKENVRAKLRVIVRKILRQYGYPPDKQEKAVQTVLKQAEMLADTWAKEEIK
ncbi:MAG: type I restriction endonuclease subunit R [Chitinophagaceae bacterium]|nr:type I restriction endonuclease subunit R [Chitinophagaceae bacterium]